MPLYQISRYPGEKLLIVMPTGEQVVISILDEERIGLEAPDGIEIKKKHIPYEISFNSKLKIVNVAYFGTVTLAERKRAVKDVCDKYYHFSPLKILIDVNALEMNLSVKEQKIFGRYLAEHDGLVNARVAVLHKPEHNPNELIDVFASNNGYVLAEFNQKEKAETWLSETLNT